VARIDGVPADRAGPYAKVAYRFTRRAITKLFPLQQVHPFLSPGRVSPGRAQRTGTSSWALFGAEWHDSVSVAPRITAQKRPRERPPNGHLPW